MPESGKAEQVDLNGVTAKERAMIIREIRDGIIIAWQAGLVRNVPGVEAYLNTRIAALGVDTVTGDTSEAS